MEQEFRDLPADLLHNFDIHLQDVLKDGVIGNARKVRWTRKQFEDALRLIDPDKCPETNKCSFEDPLHRLVYILKYSPCYTSAVAHHFLESVKKNPLTFKGAVYRRKIKICCLGGGPPTEVLAITKVLTSIKEFSSRNQGDPHRFEVTVVGQTKEWKKTTYQIIPKHSNTALIVDRVKINIHFMEADLKKSLAEDARKVLEEADIVMIGAFISTFGNIFSDTFLELAQEIVRFMKPNRVLFYLDIGKNLRCQKLIKAFDIMRNTKYIYGPIKLEVFRLSMDSIKRNAELFWKQFYQNTCLPGTLINSCAWIKRGDSNPKKPAPKYSSLFYSKDEELKSQWNEKANRNEEILKNFFKEVEQVLKSQKQTIRKRSINSNNIRKNSTSYSNLSKPLPSPHHVEFHDKTKKRLFDVSLVTRGIYKVF